MKSNGLTSNEDIGDNIFIAHCDKFFLLLVRRIRLSRAGALKVLFPFFLLSINFSTAFSQDTLKISADSSKIMRDSLGTRARANRAALLSAILPGAGQFYNKKYWKIPILYAGFIVLGYTIEFNNTNYKTFKIAYQYRVDGDSTTIDDYENIYPEADALFVRKNYYRRTRDLLWIITAGVYVLNIIDAYVDAHLSDFDISDDLSLRTQPGLQFAFDKRPIPSLSLTFTLK
jgi:hypothetical protein